MASALGLGSRLSTIVPRSGLREAQQTKFTAVVVWERGEVEPKLAAASLQKKTTLVRFQNFVFERVAFSQTID